MGKEAIMDSIAISLMLRVNPRASQSMNQQFGDQLQLVAQEQPMTGIGADIERRWNSCREQLLQWRGMGSDWDGDGADAPKPEIIDTIVGLIRSGVGRQILSENPPDSVNALRDGTISLDWYLPASTHVIMRFDAPTVAQVIKISPGKPTESFWRTFPSESWPI
jgi:hypothetical protein